MFCSKCGAQLTDNVRFCARCGEPVYIPDKQEQEQAEPVFATEKKEINYFSDNEVNQVTPMLVFEESAPKKKKGKVWLWVLIIALVLLIAAGVIFALIITLLPEDEAIDAQLRTYVQGNQFDEKVDISSLVIDEKVRDGEMLNVYCTVVAQDAELEHTQRYQLIYERNSYNWEIKEIIPCEEEKWSMLPLKGVTEEMVKEKLVGREVTLSNGVKIMLDESNLADVTIDSQNTDLENVTDKVNISYKVQSEVAECELTAEAAFVFDEDSWYLTYFKNNESGEIAYREGCAFEADEEQLKTVLQTKSITVSSNNGTQELTVDEADISGLTVDNQVFDWEKGTVTVNCSFKIEKKVAVIAVSAVATYKYNNSAWEAETMDCEAEIESLTLTGEWAGYYTSARNGSKPSVVMTVNSENNNSFEATFAFGPSDDVPRFPNGSYVMNGNVDADTLSVQLKPGAWIKNPRNVYTIELTGTLDIEQAKIVGKGFELILKEQTK